MQKRALPVRVQSPPVEIVATAGRILALGEVHRRPVTLRLIWHTLGPPKRSFNRSADRERDIVNEFGVHAEPALPREQAIIRILLLQRRRGQRGLADTCDWSRSCEPRASCPSPSGTPRPASPAAPDASATRLAIRDLRAPSTNPCRRTARQCDSRRRGASADFARHKPVRQIEPRRLPTLWRDFPEDARNSGLNDLTRFIEEIAARTARVSTRGRTRSVVITLGIEDSRRFRAA